MHPFRRFLAVAVVATALAGCSAWHAVFDPGTPAQANSVAAAEGLFTAADKAMTAAVTQHAVTLPEAQRLGTIETRVYSALVDLRRAAQTGNSVALPALLDAFNAANGSLRDAMTGDGIAVPAPTTGGAP